MKSDGILLSGLPHSPEMLIRHYDGSHLLQEWRDAPGEVATDTGTWACTISVAPTEGRTDAADLVARFVLASGRADDTAVGVSLTFSQKSRKLYVCLPSAVYAGNRFQSVRLTYPPFLPREMRGKDLPTIITDVPRLNIKPGRSRIQQLTRDLSTPAVGIYDPETETAYWILTYPNTSLGDSGFDVEENEDRSQLTVTLLAPGMREDVRYAYVDFLQASEDRGASFKIGEVFELRLRLFAFDASDITTLFDRFVEIRQDLTGPGALKHELPFSAAWTIIEEKYNRDNWVEKYQFYSVSIDGIWQVGWVGGIMSTYPLLMLGHELSVKRARKTFDFLFNGGQSELGIFYGFGDGQRWYGDDFADPDDKNVHLIRKQSDAVYFLLKQLDLMEKQGMAIEAGWDEGVRKATDALTAIWTRNGQFGQFIDAENGDILIGGSTSAAIAPAGLALAYQRYGNPAYLQVAIESAQIYYDRDVLAGVTTGAPGEILQCPDSESAFGLLESFVVLYEVTNDRHWIDKAEDMAAQCSTWTVSYDWPFPADTTFGKLGIHSSGAVWANVQNKHGAPAICTLSGDSLWKLFRATGNRYYLDVLRDTAHNLTQYVSRNDKPIDGMPSGWVNERVNLSDWDNNIGGVFRGSCWPLEALMITVAEIPGIYVQIDTGLVVAFDHVDTETVVRDNSSITLSITNPTAFIANVNLFAETLLEASIPIGQNALVNRPAITLDAGETKIIAIASSGEFRLIRVP